MDAFRSFFLWIGFQGNPTVGEQDVFIVQAAVERDFH